MTVTTVFEINNKGILYLRRGMYGEAANTFQNALIRLRDLVYGKIKSDANALNDKCRTTPFASPVTVKQSFSLQQHENPFSLYYHAFTLSAQSEKEILTSTDVENLASACLLYNLGLTYHMRGLALVRSKDLAQASSLYHKAAALAEHVESDASEQNLLLILAIFSNMGHIHSEHYDTKAAARCMDLLQMILESDECHEYLGEEHYNYFFWPLFLFSERPVLLAPAA